MRLRVRGRLASDWNQRLRRRGRGCLYVTPAREMSRSEQERAFLLKQAMREVLAEGMTEADRKRIVKEAIGEWLDAQLARVGIWTLAGLSSLALAALAWFTLVRLGWRPPL